MIIDHPRDIEELKSLYNSRPMNDGLYTFEHILNNHYLFCFYSETDNLPPLSNSLPRGERGQLRGFIFINADDEDKLYLSGVSVPKNMSDNIDAIISVCNAFDTDMYSETDYKPAQLVLKKAGFKQIDKNIFVRYKNGKK